MSQSYDPHNPFAESERTERRSGCIVITLALGTILLIGGLFTIWLASRPSSIRTEIAVEPTSEPDQPTPIATDERVTIRWYVGLGAGTNSDQIDTQQRIVDEFNETHPHIRLELEIAEGDLAGAQLETRYEANDAPDIAGPVTNLVMYRYPDYWLSMEPLITETGYDLSEFHPELLDHYRLGADNELVAIPYLVYPSALWYNTALFDAAGLAYPPHEYGTPYIASDGTEYAWNIDTVEMLARELTLDADGRTANDPDFDPQDITQFGFDMQWAPPLGQATLFGAGSMVDASGQVRTPDHWREFWHWQYNAMWDAHFMPTNDHNFSDLLNAGNAFSSGNVAMMPQQLWYVCCAEHKNWDLAAIPEYDGTATVKLHADTFLITNQTEHPREAFEVLTYLIEQRDLVSLYGGFPARTSQQPYFLDLLDIANPQIDFEVFVAGLAHIERPNHEAGLAAYPDAESRLMDFQSEMLSSPNLDLDAEIERLEADLQAMLDEMPEN